MKTLFATTFLALLLVFSPATVGASATDPNTGVVPCGNQVDREGQVSDPCEIGDLFTLIDNIIDWILIVMIPLAVVSIAIGGAMLVLGGANEEWQSKGKEIITSALWGLVIVLAAWLIVWAIVEPLVRSDFDVPLEQSS